jgi:O-antigen ligase
MIALLKIAAAGLAVLSALRHGLRIPPVHPAYAFLIMFAVTLALGLHPSLSQSESLRTLIGSITPFALAFCVIPREAARLIILAVILGPIANVLLGGMLMVTGWVSFFDGGRLGGTGHPAFLGGLAFTAIMACVLEMLRERRTLWLVLAGANGVILLATAARAPLALIALFLLIVFVFVRSRALDAGRKFGLALFGASALAVGIMALLALPGSRLGAITTDASGRDLMWPIFVAAIEQRPWFGGGIGYGKFVLDANDLLAKLLGTTAAHNEYLRITADMGLVGMGMLLVFGAIWVAYEGRRVPRLDRVVAALAMLMFALRAISDNMLIATLALPHFAWIAAVYARGRWEAQETARPLSPRRRD